MISRAEIKRQAREQLKGNLAMIVLCGIVYCAVVMAASCVPVVGTIATIVFAGPLVLGFIKVHLNVTYGEKPEVSTLFEPFQTCLGNSIAAYLLVYLYTMLWTLLLIVPGLIKSFSYSMTFYILGEKPNMTATEAITESRRIMDGHKMEYFVLMLSFTPWILLSVVTLGIAYIYVLPYMYLTMTNFYHRIKNQNSNEAETAEI